MCWVGLLKVFKPSRVFGFAHDFDAAMILRGGREWCGMLTFSGTCTPCRRYVALWGIGRGGLGY